MLKDTQIETKIPTKLARIFPALTPSVAEGGMSCWCKFSPAGVL